MRESKKFISNWNFVAKTDKKQSLPPPSESDNSHQDPKPGCSPTLELQGPGPSFVASGSAYLDLETGDLDALTCDLLFLLIFCSPFPSLSSPDSPFRCSSHCLSFPFPVLLSFSLCILLIEFPGRFYSCSNGNL